MEDDIPLRSRCDSSPSVRSTRFDRAKTGPQEKGESK